VQNPTSKATGLIQFMPATAKSLGTTIAQLAAMSAVEQLDVVERYLQPYRNKMRMLPDVYMTILFPAAVAKPESFVLFKAPTRRYAQNRGLDVNHDGQVTKGEAASKVQLKLAKGLTSLRG
jgi:hypothetical protein